MRRCVSEEKAKVNVYVIRVRLRPSDQKAKIGQAPEFGHQHTRTLWSEDKAKGEAAVVACAWPVSERKANAVYVVDYLR